MLKRLTDVYLTRDYILATDSYHNVYSYIFTLQEECVPGKEFNLDKRIANEVCAPQFNFVEIYPTSQRIWAITSLRQIMVCDEPTASQLKFTHYNGIFNVMNASTSDKH
jgi:hypothetical protein